MKMRPWFIFLLHRIKSTLLHLEVIQPGSWLKSLSGLNMKLCGMTEIEVANGLLCAGAIRGIRFPALMVGSDERISLYRHPAATNKKVKNYVLLATVVEREGICANVTRSVYFGSAPEELKMKQDVVNTIEAAYQLYSM